MMVMHKAGEIVAQCDLLRELDPDAREVILAAGQLTHVPQGSFFFHQGEEARRLYILVEGRVKLAQVTPEGNQVIINYFGPGSGLGIIVALSDMAYPLSAEAVETCQAIGWSREDMKRLMFQYPQLALNGLEMIGRRFARLQERFQEVSTRRVEQRVARALLRLVRQFGRRVPEGVLIDMTLSRQDLAEMTGTNLYNVSRILSRWESEGWVTSGRQRIILCRPHDIVAIAEDLS